jgi:signal transduction histidine kinase
MDSAQTAAFQRERADLFARRLPFGIAMLVVIFTGTAVIESFAHPDRLRPFVGQAVTFALGSAAALLAARSSRVRLVLPAVIAGLTAATMGALALVAVTTGDGAENLLMVALTFTTMAAVILPFTWRLQGVVAAGAIGAVAAVAPWLPWHETPARLLFLFVQVELGLILGTAALEQEARRAFERRALLEAANVEKDRLIAELVRANRLKAEFLSTISHELRTPLNVIAGYADMLGDPDFGALSDEQGTMLAGIQAAAHQQLTLIEASLDLNRLEARDDILQTEPVDMEALFADVRRTLRAARLEVAVRWRNELGTRPMVSDRHKLGAILHHLVDNAIKFTPAGEVEVRARPLAQDRVALVVRDTGIGIAPENVALVFELFRQLDGSETRLYGGTGIGLHLVKRLVERLGGTIELASVPGVGSTFTVTLPAGTTSTHRPPD